MDAYVSRGARPAACAGGGSQEAEHGAQEVEEDKGQDQTDDVQAVLTVRGGHNGYLLCEENPNRPHMELGGHAGEETGSCELLYGPHKGKRVWCYAPGVGVHREVMAELWSEPLKSC